MENRYGNYLPDMVKELQEFQKLGEIENGFLAEASAAKDELVENQWILTAKRNGLLRLAKMMGFLGAEEMETEDLREEILYRWNSRSPYTQFHLMDWLDGCCGVGAYTVSLQREGYLFHLVLELRAKEKKDFLEKQLRKMIPANLVLEMSLNTNTHGDLKIFTHGQLKKLGWTHGQIPYEDLTPYQK